MKTRKGEIFKQNFLTYKHHVFQLKND